MNGLVGALSILITYLAGSSASVLENILVEKEQIASAVYSNEEFRPDTIISFTLSSVDASELAQVEARFFEVLHETADGELDMVYMTDCVRRQRRQLKFYAESSTNFFTDSIINDFLFGNRDGSNLRTLETLQEYDELEMWTEAQWKHFLKRWISDAHHISILGKPSAKMSKRIKAEETERVAAQKARLGEAGLKALEEKLAAAKAENDKEIPKGLLDQFKVPDTSSIHFIHTTTARSGEARKLGKLDNPIQYVIDQDRSSLPLFIQFEHIESNFIHLTLVLGTEGIPVHLRPLLSIYLENFFNAPVKRGERTIDFEQVVMELEKDTVGYGIDAGSGIGNPEVLKIVLQVESEKYETAIRWFKDLLWNGIFDLTVGTLACVLLDSSLLIGVTANQSYNC